MAVCRDRGLGQWGSIWGTMLVVASSGVGAGEGVGFLWVWGRQLGRVVLAELVGGLVYGVLVGQGSWVDRAWAGGAFVAAFWDLVWFEGVV